MPFRAISLMNSEVSYILRDGDMFFITILKGTQQVSLKSYFEEDLVFIRNYIVCIG